MIPDGNDRFFGIYPSTVLPMRANAAPDWDSYARHTEASVMQPGVVGVLCNGHAGENFVLDMAEKRRAVEVSVATVGRSRIVIAGINQESSPAAAEEAQIACAAGADAIMVFAPNSFALAHAEDCAVRHHRIIAEAVPDMPVFLFQASVNAGQMGFTPPVLAQLLALPTVIGIKEGSWEANRYDALRRQVKALRPDVAVMASGDEHLLACYVHGSDGSIVSLADIVPELIVALDEAVRRHDLPLARTLHDRLEPLADAIYGTPPGGRATAQLKWCLAELGRIADPVVRAPVGPVTADEATALAAALSHAGL